MPGGTLKNKQSGFTTVELLIALGVLVLALVIATLLVRSARAQTRDAIRISDVKQIQAGLELFFAEQYSYPVTAEAIALGSGNAACLGATGFAASCSSGRVYMPQVPANLSGNPYAYISRTNTEAACTSSPCAKYAFQFELEKARGTLAKGLNCARPEGIKPGACQ